MLLTVQKFVQERPIIAGVAAAAASVVAIYFIVRQLSFTTSQEDEKPPLHPLGPEWLLVRSVESISSVLDAEKQQKQQQQHFSSSSSKKSKHGSFRFIFKRSEVAEFFNSNSNQEKFPEIFTNCHPTNLNTTRETLMRIATEYEQLEKRRNENFDDENKEHLKLLEILWKIGINHDFPQEKQQKEKLLRVEPEEEQNQQEKQKQQESQEQEKIPFERTSKHWEKLGFQGLDPKTDLRAGGMLALDIFTDFVQQNPQLVQTMQKHCDEQHKSGGMNWMLIACASIHITVVIMRMSPYFWSRPMLCFIYRGALLIGHPTGDNSNNIPKMKVTNEEMEEGPQSEQDLVGGKFLVKRNEEWEFYHAICRVHHYLMLMLWKEWIASKTSVMEFENFVRSKVWEVALSGQHVI